LRRSIDCSKLYFLRKEKGWSLEGLRRLLEYVDFALSLPEELEEKLEERLREEVGEMSIEVFGYMEEKAYRRGLE